MTPGMVSSPTSRLASAYRTAATALATIGNAWAAEWPKAPAAIAAPAFVLGGDLERDLLGKPCQPCRKVFGTKHFAREIKRCSRMDRSARRRNLPAEDWPELRKSAEKALAEAEAYELACERVRLASGIRNALEDLDRAKSELLAHVAGLMEAPAERRSDLMAQAQALNAVALIPVSQRSAADINGQWLSRLAAAVVRLSAEEEAA